MLQPDWGLGPLRSDGVLLLGLTVDPPKRLGSEPKAALPLRTLSPPKFPYPTVKTVRVMAKFQAAPDEFAKRVTVYLDLDTRVGRELGFREPSSLFTRVVHELRFMTYELCCKCSCELVNWALPKKNHLVAVYMS
jgi:hypothetical protein